MLGAIVLACAVAAGAPQSGERGWETVTLWVDAVDAHEPGAHDAALRSLTALPTVVFEEGLPYFTLVLRRALATEGTEPFDDLFRRLSREMTLSPAEDARLQALAMRVSHPSPLRFLKRAMMLHTDAALRYPGSHLTTSEGMGQQAADGRNFGVRGRSWHWLIAHALAHLALYERPEDGDVLLWYQAVGNHFWSRSNHTEGRPHLARALAAFPDDAELLFLQGVSHEALAEPHIQAAIAEQRRVVDRRRGERYVTTIGDTGAERRRAMDAFQQALARDPQHWEARLRLGRLLGLAGRDTEAVAALRAVIDAVDEPWLRYQAFMFLGQAEEGLGRDAAAVRAYESARALFPHAQSAIVSLARLHVRSGDVGQATTLLLELTAGRAGDSDPWWFYDVVRVPRAEEAWMRRVRLAFRGQAP